MLYIAQIRADNHMDIIMSDKYLVHVSEELFDVVPGYGLGKKDDMGKVHHVTIDLPGSAVPGMLLTLVVEPTDPVLDWQMLRGALGYDIDRLVVLDGKELTADQVLTLMGTFGATAYMYS